MLSRKKIAVIGAGHIGRALIGGLLRAKLVKPGSVSVSRRGAAALAELKKDFGVRVFTDNKKAVAGADIVIVAVKPQAAPGVLAEIAPALQDGPLVITVMAGIKTESVQRKLKKPC